MIATAAIAFRGRVLQTTLSPLETAQIVARMFGYYDLDIKDNDPGQYRIIAYGDGKREEAKGRTMADAVERLLEKVAKGADEGGACGAVFERCVDGQKIVCVLEKGHASSHHWERGDP